MKFTIIIPPTGQRRARSRVIAGHARTYKDPKQATEESRLAGLLFAHKPGLPLQGAICLQIRAFLPVPVSKSGKWKKSALDGKIRPCVKPDLDNLAKNILDVMNGVFFADDRQVVYLAVEKWYGYPARWEIEILEV